MEENSFVLDTHVWVSIFHRNKTEELLDALIENGITLVSTTEQEKELLHILHDYPEVKELLPGNPKDYAALLTSITQSFSSQKRFALLTDYRDNYLVDLAHQSQSVLVSDDSTFKPLKLMKRPKVKLISKKEFYKVIGW